MGYNVYYGGEIAISPSLTEADAATLGALLNNRPTDAPALFESIETANPKPEIPWCSGILSVSEDRSKLLPEEDDSRRGLDAWLRIALDHLLVPAGYVLNGSVDFKGEDPDDRGTIYVKDNTVEVVDDVILNPGPSWERNHYATATLKQTIQDLLDSSDESGFSSDFIMVATPPLKELRHLLQLS